MYVCVKYGKSCCYITKCTERDSSMRWFFGLFSNVQCRNCTSSIVYYRTLSFFGDESLITDPCSLRCPHICRETFPGDCNHDVHKMTHSAESERFGLYGCSIFLHALCTSTLRWWKRIIQYTLHMYIHTWLLLVLLWRCSWNKEGNMERTWIQTVTLS